MNDCIIHIGMHKTGSSSIQKSLHGHFDDNFYYADLNDNPNHSISLSKIFVSKFDKKEERKILINKFEEIYKKSTGRVVVFSGEGICTRFNYDELKEMNIFFKKYFNKISLVGYVRSPSSYISSSFQQRVKSGDIEAFELGRLYRRYKRRFLKFDNVFGQENVKLWKFNPLKFPGKCVVQDFCLKIGMNLPPGKILRINESISRQVVALLYVHSHMSHKQRLKPLKRRERINFLEKTSGLFTDKFRFSPLLLNPILDSNREDIDWIEERLGESFSEDIDTQKQGDIGCEEDLFKIARGSIGKILQSLKEGVPSGISSLTLEEIAANVHSFARCKNGTL